MDTRRLKKEYERAKQGGNFKKAAELANELGHLYKRNNKPKG
jgi:hypothetical protein